MRRILSMMGIGAVCMLLSGCCMMRCGNPAPKEVVVTRINAPVVIDGKADEAFWKELPAYEFFVGKDRQEDYGVSRIPKYAAKVRLAHDDDNFYLLAEFEDDDLVQFSTEDSGHFYTQGDLVELFLMNNKSGHYWEIYGTPNSLKSLMFFQNRGRVIFPYCLKENPDMEVKATMDGTLNDWSDTDRGCVIEMKVSKKEFTKCGDLFKEGESWRILVCRYNYSKSLESDCGAELSMINEMTKTNFHKRSEYLPVVFSSLKK